MTWRYSFGPFVLDTARGTLTRDGAALAAGTRGLAILAALLGARQQVVPKEALIAAAWPGLVVEDSNLTVQVAALRKLLGRTPGGGEWIVTVPRAGYRFAADALAEALALGPPEGGAEPPARPTIALLPFTNLGFDPAQDWFADGIAEDIIAGLSRYRWFGVAGRHTTQLYKLRPADPQTIARELGVRYLLAGTVRRSDARVRISVELVDATSGACLWTDAHDVDADGLLAVQDTIAERVVGALEPQLLRSVGASAARRPRGDPGAWELTAQGSWLFHHVTQATHQRARELFRSAAARDPESTEARLWIGRVDAGLVAYGWSHDPARDLEEGTAAAIAAVQLDPASPYAHYALAIVSIYAESFARAAEAADAAVALSPSFSLGHLVGGMARLFAGEAGAAAGALAHGLALNRFDPQNFVWHNLLALARLFGGDGQAGLAHAIAALHVRPSWHAAAQTAAACCAALGRHAEARQWNQRAAAMPRTMASALRPLWRHNPAWEQSLRALGVEP